MSYVTLTLHADITEISDNRMSGDFMQGKVRIAFRTPGFCVELYGNSDEVKKVLINALEKFES